MQETNQRSARLLPFLPLGLLALLMAGCGGESGGDQARQDDVAKVTQLTKEERLKERVLGRMRALIDRDWEKAYDYLSPARRQLTPLDVYVNRMNISAILRKSAEVEKMDCGSSTCDVEVKVGYVYLGGVVDAMQGYESDRVVREKWVEIDGQWWFVPE